MPESRTATIERSAEDLRADGFHDVGAAADVPRLEGRRATADGRRVAVFRLPSGFAATDAACPHRGGPLYDGIVADGCVTCPLHNWRLDLSDGTVAGQDERMPIHEVVEAGGRLWVRPDTSRPETAPAAAAPGRRVATETTDDIPEPAGRDAA